VLSAGKTIFLLEQANELVGVAARSFQVVVSEYAST
jgi:hypothetical protein